MPSLLMDISPLRFSAPFRRLWAGTTLSSVGGQLTTFAVALQVYTLTGSSIAVGGVGLAAALPAVVLGLLGGAIADAVDRRRLVLVTSVLLAVVSAGFAAQAFAGLGSIWLLYGLVAVQSALGSINAPARRTFLPRLLPTEKVAAGAALTMFGAHLSVTVGPVLAGVLTGAWGLQVCYLIDAVSFLAAVYGVARLPAMPPAADAGRPGVRTVGRGLRFIVRTRVLTGALLADISATALGMPIALFPAINAERFGGNPTTLGLLSAALAVGGIVGTTLSGPVGRIRRQGRAILIAGAGWGAGLVGFGLAGSLWLALGMLVLAGVADVTSVVLRTTVVQVVTPDGYRGRVSAAEHVVGVAVPQLGSFRAGAIGSLTSSTVSAVSGGLATIAGAALVGLAVPAFARYRSPAASEAAEPAAAP